jgi:ankyrin repeat protein
LAGYFGAARAVRALIAAGEKVDTRKTLKGQTTLHLAVEQRKRSVVDLLLDAGADTKIQDNAGRTVLHLAADQSDGSLIDALLDAGADGNIQDEEGRTALHLAAASFRRTNETRNVRRDGSVFERAIAKANKQSFK